MQEKFDGRFTAFQLLTDAIDEYCRHISCGSGFKALESIHKNADKIAKELLNGDYVYEERK